MPNNKTLLAGPQDRLLVLLVVPEARLQINKKYKVSDTTKAAIDGGWIDIATKYKVTTTSQASIAVRRDKYNLQLKLCARAYDLQKQVFDKVYI